MEHKFYSQCGLLVLKDETSERLFRVEQRNGKRKAVPADFISGTQKFIRVCVEHNLIITPGCLYTLDGKIAEEGDFGCVTTVCYKDTLLLISHNSSAADKAERVWLWDKKQIVWRQNPDKLIHTDKYIAVFQKGNWKIYDKNGQKVEVEGKLSSSVQIKGDLLISDAVGCHDVYSLKTGKVIMYNQQLVRVSARRNFAIGVSLQRKAIIWCDGKSMVIDNVAFVDIIDDAELFFIKYQNFTYYSVFRYAATLSALTENLVFTQVEFIAYDDENKQLAVATDCGISFYRVEKQSMIVEMPDF